MIQNSAGGAAVHRPSLQAMTGRVAAVATALFLVLFLVLSVSRAAFSATTANENNFVTTADGGGVTLTDNDQGSALFELADVGPNTDYVQCINVRYAGDFSSGDVRMYASITDQIAPTVDLAEFLDVEVNRVEIDAADFDDTSCDAFDDAKDPVGLGLVDLSTNVYTGTLDGFPTDYASAPIGFPGVESVFAYEVTVSVQDDPNAAGARADWNFTWETQSA